MAGCHLHSHGFENMPCSTPDMTIRDSASNYTYTKYCVRWSMQTKQCVAQHGFVSHTYCIPSAGPTRIGMREYLHNEFHAQSNPPRYLNFHLCLFSHLSCFPPLSNSRATTTSSPFLSHPQWPTLHHPGPRHRSSQRVGKLCGMRSTLNGGH